MKDSEYNMIVGYYNDSAILMRSEINLSNHPIKITKGAYKLESIKGKNLTYYHFESITCENK